ncbi:MAG: T9SS type A sorting domain-containing protein, partial [Bacteroidota bacterium]
RRAGPAEEALAAKFRVYPNPAQRVINLELPEGMENATVELYDQLGRKAIALTNLKRDGTHLTGKLSAEIENGVYVVVVKNETERYTSKLLVAN